VATHQEEDVIDREALEQVGEAGLQLYVLLVEDPHAQDVSCTGTHSQLVVEYSKMRVAREEALEKMVLMKKNFSHFHLDWVRF
jgi:hypothetical protein